MRMMIKTALFAVMVAATSAVAPARDAPTMAGAVTAALPPSALPRVSVPATESLLDQGELLSGPEPIVAIPEVPAPPVPTLNLRQLVARHAGTDPGDAQMDCLARAIYFETRGEPLRGQLAVGEVILNRAASRKFPNSYCGVIKQHRQFSFVRNGRIPEPRRNSKAWRTAVAIAEIVHEGHHATKMREGALFFHATYVNPRWRLKRIGSIGNHIFYQ